jgi:hypothetical protein
VGFHVWGHPKQAFEAVVVVVVVVHLLGARLPIWQSKHLSQGGKVVEARQ